MLERVNVKIHCQDCDASGLHIGHLETDGTATICPTCRGKGYIEAEYIPFKSKKRITGVRKVFQSAFGCQLFESGEEIYELQNGNKIKINFDEHDCSYDDWFDKNKSPILLTELTCPLIASNQDIDVVLQMECDKDMDLGTPIGLWKCYENKEECWKKYLEDK